MTGLTPRRVIVACAFMVFLAGWFGYRGTHAVDGAPAELLLVVPDAFGRDDPIHRRWLDAFAEEGVPVATITATELVRAAGRGPLARGFIVPDSYHVRAGVPLVEALREQVRAGARLMLVFDALSADPAGGAATASAWRALSGIEVQGAAGGHPAVVQGPLTASAAVVRELGITPGRMVGAGAPDALRATTYLYPDAQFTHFRTGQVDAGRVLMRSGDSVVAFERPLGRGMVLYVNLPLGYLKQRTDGLWLHAFVRFFAERHARTPRIADAPDGVGGVIVNWHIDDRKALGFLPMLEQLGMMGAGPASVHITAGPDADADGDGMGTNLDGNPSLQAWLRSMRRLGHAIGSHGGWIHNRFAREVGDTPNAQHRAWIERNRTSIEHVLGEPVLEYSSPSGNHPAWLDEVLRQDGVRAYYSPGNVGMGPTRAVSGAEPRLWAFPIVANDQVASFEEAHWAGMSGSALGTWLQELADFCIASRTVRLFYFHPIGVASYPREVSGWFRTLQALQAEGRLRGYTMSGLVDFLDRRAAASLVVRRDPGGADTVIALDGGQKGVERLAVMLPKDRFGRPRIAQGQGDVSDAGDAWLVRAGVNRRIEIRAREYDGA